MEDGQDQVESLYMIEIQNFTSSPIDEDFVRRVINGTLREAGIKGIISIGVVFVGENRMRVINKKYHRENRITDVLSFGAGKQFVSSPEEGKFLGEIIICISFLKKQAEKMGVGFNKEFAHALIHGTLHLLGWEHEKNKKDAEAMHAKEEEIMRTVING